MRPATQRKIRAIFSFYFRTLHGVALHGLEHLPKPGEAAVLVVNHQSLADGCFVATFLPGSPMFAVSRDMARRWWARPFLAVVCSFAVDPTNAIAIKSMIAAVHEGNTLVMFPEGRITTTGSLMKIYDGAAAVADRAHAKLIVIRIDGLQRTRLSRMAGSTRVRWFPRLSMTVLPPIPIAVDPALRGRARRISVGHAVRRAMQQAEFEAANTSRSLFAALLETISYQGGRMPMSEDERRSPMTYRRFLRHVYALVNCLARDITAGEVVGLMVPNSVEVVTAFMALLTLGAIPVMLDTKVCAETNLRSCAAAGASIILVSRAFAHPDLDGNAVPKMKNGPRLIWLEDIMPPGALVRVGRLTGCGNSWCRSCANLIL